MAGNVRPGPVYQIFFFCQTIQKLPFFEKNDIMPPFGFGGVLPYKKKLFAINNYRNKC